MENNRLMIEKLVTDRIARGLSQADVAKMMNCTQSRVAKFESKRDSQLRVDDLSKYVQAIGIDLTLKFTFARPLRVRCASHPQSKRVASDT